MCHQLITIMVFQVTISQVLLNQEVYILPLSHTKNDHITIQL